MLYYILSILIIVLIVYLIVRRYANSDKPARNIGFFHPYANTCGGGERVLWCAIKALDGTGIRVFIYTGDIETDDEITSRGKGADRLLSLSTAVVRGKASFGLE